VPPLVQALKSRHDRLRKLAIACLGLLGAEAGSAVPALIAVFSDRDEEIRNLAADALARIGPAAVPALLKATRDSAGPVRAAAYRALGQVGPPDLATRTALRRGLRDADIEVRVQTAVALWRVGVGGQEPVKLLVAMLDDSDEGAASAAVTALAEIHLASGGSQPEVTEALVKTLKQRDTRLKLVALQALWRVDREERVVLPLMREALTDRNPLVRKRAVALLGELGRDARVGGLLLEALEERDPRVREEALAALTRRGEAALPALEKALDHERSRIRLGALEVIARLGPQAARLREKVIKAGRDKDSRVRKAAEVALLQIEPQDAKEFLKLLRLLEEIEKKERESKDRP
jgi:HEAT repeat protein